MDSSVKNCWKATDLTVLTVQPNPRFQNPSSHQNFAFVLGQFSLHYLQCVINKQHESKVCMSVKERGATLMLCKAGEKQDLPPRLLLFCLRHSFSPFSKFISIKLFYPFASLMNVRVSFNCFHGVFHSLFERLQLDSICFKLSLAFIFPRF